jgi:hypothetical protein
LKAFLGSPRVSKEVAKEAVRVLGKHTYKHGVGLSGHTAVHAAVLFGVSQLGGGSATEAVAAAVAGYAVTEVMKKLGLTSEKAAQLLSVLSRKLLAAYREWRKDHELFRLTPVHDAQDPIEVGLERFAQALA